MMLNKSKKDMQDFIMAYNDKINDVVNKDAVRAETIKRENEQGITDNFINQILPAAWAMYSQALNVGFDADQAFVLALKEIGFDSQ